MKAHPAWWEHVSAYGISGCIDIFMYARKIENVKMKMKKAMGGTGGR